MQYGLFPDQGTNLCPLPWQAKFLTPGPPEKSPETLNWSGGCAGHWEWFKSSPGDSSMEQRWRATDALGFSVLRLWPLLWRTVLPNLETWNFRILESQTSAWPILDSWVGTELLRSCSGPSAPFFSWRSGEAGGAGGSSGVSLGIFLPWRSWRDGNFKIHKNTSIYGYLESCLHISF